MPDYYPQEKGVIRRDRAGEFRDIMAKELMFEALGLIPVAGMAGKFAKGRKALSEYSSQVRPLRSLRASEEHMRKEGRTTKKMAEESLKKKSAEFRKDLLSGKVDALGKPQTEVGRSHLAKYGPHYTDAGVESYMGTPGIAASAYGGGVMNLKDWTPVAVSRFKEEIKKNDKIYDKFVKGFTNLLRAKHKIGGRTWKEKFSQAMEQFNKAEDRGKLAKAREYLLEDIVPTKHLKIKGVQEAFLKPAAKQARSELAKQFPKVPR